MLSYIYKIQTFWIIYTSFTYQSICPFKHISNIFQTQFNKAPAGLQAHLRSSFFYQDSANYEESEMKKKVSSFLT